MQQKFVITGAPGTGKTSVIQKLEADGYYCHHEIIRTMTQEAKKQGNPEAFISNPLTFVSDPLAFNMKILKGRIAQFVSSDALDKPLVFFDRAIPDVLAYMDFFNQKYGEMFVEACEKHLYDRVFLLPPWKEIYVSDNERLESFEEAKAIHKHLKATYQKFGYNTVDVPFGSIRDRVTYILEHLNKI